MPPPEDLVGHWTKQSGLLPPEAPWQALDGGRTNSVWLVRAADRAIVVKLYRANAATPLFANDPEAEAAALKALAGTGLAPRLLATGQTPSGPSLAYQHVSGRNWRAEDGVQRVAEALARLHRQPPPRLLPPAPNRAETLRAQARAMLAELGPGGAALATEEPGCTDALQRGAASFLHGDATAGNALVANGSLTFIDWQCPARGDPVLDIAIVLSPAMQAVSGNAPLSKSQETAFFAAYGDEEMARRYRSLAPLFHWRMAAYCLWRAARGDEGYADAAALEIAHLRATR